MSKWMSCPGEHENIFVSPIPLVMSAVKLSTVRPARLRTKPASSADSARFKTSLQSCGAVKFFTTREFSLT
jgi:hypothetical protein